MFKNNFLTVVLALLLGIGLTGPAFANGINELDALDYAESQYDIDTSVTQVDKSYRSEVEQSKAWISGLDPSNELDPSDYENMTPVYGQSYIKDSRTVHCAAFNGSETGDQMKNCG